MADRWMPQKFNRAGKTEPIEERGDCVRTCVAGILGMHRDEVPKLHADSDEERGQQWRSYLEGLGYAFVSHLVGDHADHVPRCLWIASVPNGSGSEHCVVAKGKDLVHDPAGSHTDRQFKDLLEAGKVIDAFVLVQLDPAATKAVAA